MVANLRQVWDRSVEFAADAQAIGFGGRRNPVADAMREVGAIPECNRWSLGRLLPINADDLHRARIKRQRLAAIYASHAFKVDLVAATGADKIFHALGRTSVRLAGACFRVTSHGSRPSYRINPDDLPEFCASWSVFRVGMLIRWAAQCTNGRQLMTRSGSGLHSRFRRRFACYGQGIAAKHSGRISGPVF